MADSYIVTAPLVIAKDTSGQMVHLYRGAPVSDGFSTEERDRLVEAGMVAKISDPYENLPEPVTTPDLTDPDAAPATADATDGATASDGGAPAGPEKPGGNASTETWAQYAVESGQATEEEVAGKSRDELRAAYGG